MIDDYIKKEKEKLSESQKKEKEQLLLKKQQEDASLCAYRSISSGNLRLFADVETKSLRLYFKDKEITKSSGLHSSFSVSKEWFSLKNAQWQIQKTSERKMVLILYYESILLSQICTLICKDDNTLEIKIEIKINKPIFFTHRYIRLEFHDKYKNWMTEHEQGDFLGSQYINGTVPIRLKYNRVSHLMLVPEDKKDYPMLFFRVFSQIDKRIFSIHKKKEADEECLCVDSSLIISKGEGLIEPGKYSYFEGKIILDKEIRLKEKPTSSRAPELKKDNLRFVFDQGRGRIFWRDKELTTGLGVYSSMRSCGVWCDSYQAAWQVSYKDGNKMIAVGDWPYIPISQTWQFELVNKNIISWRADIAIYGEVSLELEQANIMFSSAYKNWAVPDLIQGKFLDEYTQHYDILPFRFWYGKTKEIAATAKTLPRIIFKSAMKKEDLRVIVENTDALYQARLLQYQKMNKSNLSPGKYLYFNGVIEIGSGE